MRLLICNSKKWFSLNNEIKKLCFIREISRKEDLNFELVEEFKPDYIFFPHWNWIVDKKMDHELRFAQQEEMQQRKDLLQDSIKILNEREKEILYSRKLTDDPVTLEKLSKKYKISRERIRQIESKAFEKLQKHMLNSAKSKNLLPAN